MEPGIIKKLEQEVVNRIAAGEIIQRPANAIKELVENSLDAKSSSIQISLKTGGLKLLQIQDNGTGIRLEDLEIVCERFTTSKLSKYEDLSSIATFGFRGEALASISHVAHLTIQTKTANERCGYRANYQDGKLKEKPKPCAANQGTTISIEDLFYNMPQRRQCLKSPSEEYQKICEIVSKYAIHNPQVAFLLRKFGEQPSVKTTINSTHEKNIQIIYGSQIANNLLSVEMTNDKYGQLNMKAFITTVNFTAKKFTFVLFINHRAVDCAGLKAAIESIYNAYLPKGAQPFVYMALEMEPANLDVNVHPTKHEVRFLYEDEIIALIKGQIEMRLLGSNSTRALYKQLKLPRAPEVSAADDNNQTNVNNNQTYAKDLVRTDARDQKLERFLYNSKDLHDSSSSRDMTVNNANKFGNKSLNISLEKSTKEVRLTSVVNMRKRIEDGCSLTLRKTIKESVFVGVVDHEFALFQYEKSLCMCNTLKFSEEFFYQRLVYGFQNFDMVKIEPALDIKNLIRMALDTEDSGWTESDGDKDELSERASIILINKAPIMREYFSMEINDNGELKSLPALLSNNRYFGKIYPCSTFLPNYMLRLATEVEWETEDLCFETFCRETASFYARISNFAFRTESKEQSWAIEHIVYPAFKRFLLPPVSLKKHLYELASLPKLYRVFERC